MTSHMCPVGCGRKAGEGKLMCLSCWREVPDDIKRDVYRTFRAWRSAQDGDSSEKWQAYLDVRSVAIGAIS